MWVKVGNTRLVNLSKIYVIDIDEDGVWMRFVDGGRIKYKTNTKEDALKLYNQFVDILLEKK